MDPGEVVVIGLTRHVLHPSEICGPTVTNMMSVVLGEAAKAATWGV